MIRWREFQTVVFFGILYALLFPDDLVAAHSGNTDSYGGHKKRANGTYHCHSNPCLEDARQREYEYYFPLGQEHGREGNDRTKYGLEGNDQSEKIIDFIYANFDADQASYLVPYAFSAYKAGYKDTYVLPKKTFWKKYGGFLAMTPILFFVIMFVGSYVYGAILMVMEGGRKVLNIIDVRHKKKPPNSR